MLPKITGVIRPKRGKNRIYGVISVFRIDPKFLFFELTEKNDLFVVPAPFDPFRVRVGLVVGIEREWRFGTISYPLEKKIVDTVSIVDTTAF